MDKDRRGPGPISDEYKNKVDMSPMRDTPWHRISKGLGAVGLSTGRGKTMQGGGGGFWQEGGFGKKRGPSVWGVCGPSTRCP